MEGSSQEQDLKGMLLQKAYIQALLDNKNNLSHWKQYKERYVEVINNLSFYNEKCKHSVCLPVGSKAFIKGQLVHTNDVWVTLGCGWFLKTGSKKATDICKRRIQNADELIEKWEKESKLLENMREFSTAKDVFRNSDSQEIIESFDATAEEQWKEEHREKERNYRQQLKETKEKTNSVILKNEQDIWEHLEALELQEELEDELNRLGCDSETSSGDCESDDQDNTSNRSGISKEGDHTDNEYETSQEQLKYISKDNPPGILKHHTKYNNSSKLLRDNSVLPNIKKISFEEVSECLSERITEMKSIVRPVVAISEILEENVPSISQSDENKRPLSQFKMNRLSQR